MILELFNRLTPEHRKKNPNDLLRSYVLIGVLMTNSTSISLVILLLLTVLPLPDDVQWIGLSISVTLVFCYISILVFFSKTGHYKISSNLVITILSLSIFLAMQLTGSYAPSSMTQLILLIPVSAFLLLGLKTGLVWMFISLAISLSLWLLSSINIGFVQLFDEQVNLEMNTHLHLLLFLMVCGAIVVYELINEDLKSKLEHERNKLAYEASHDSLTGIPNRLEFYRRLNYELKEAEIRERPMAVAYIDLDGFKPINDTYGHHAGDILLKNVASRLESNLRRTDTTARLGGDEFALILPAIESRENLSKLCNMLLEAIKEPVDIDDKQCQVRASIGIAMYPEHADNANDLCAYADEAMYKAKEKHDCYVFYNT